MGPEDLIELELAFVAERMSEGNPYHWHKISIRVIGVTSKVRRVSR